MSTFRNKLLSFGWVAAAIQGSPIGQDIFFPMYFPGAPPMTEVDRALWYAFSACLFIGGGYMCTAGRRSNLSAGFSFLLSVPMFYYAWGSPIDNPVVSTIAFSWPAIYLVFGLLNIMEGAKHSPTEAQVPFTHKILCLGWCVAALQLTVFRDTFLPMYFTGATINGATTHGMCGAFAACLVVGAGFMCTAGGNAVRKSSGFAMLGSVGFFLWGWGLPGTGVATNMAYAWPALYTVIGLYHVTTSEEDAAKAKKKK
eukprot:GFYU01002090.1.p1 GENE.GFYU01002090.1~~GFYU01002090.1.p1  ORF type:complete len:255 (-),score=80.66 GFYU01002090.1:209-973(-)